MAVYTRGSEVAAPFAEVWELHSRVETLEALTPDWLHLRVDRAVDVESGDPTDVLVEGTRVESSIRPFGVGPRQEWVSVIEAREERDGAANFRDVMVEGPFPRWEHTHAFLALGDDATLVHDRVVYRLPVLGPLSVLGRVGLAPMFQYRHGRVRTLLK